MRRLFMAAAACASIYPSAGMAQPAPDLRQPAGKEWLTSGGNWSNSRYSRLTQINRENVKTLRQGPPTAAGEAEVGAIISPPQVEIIDAHVRDARDKGASVLTGGRARDGDGRFYEPTVIVGVGSPDAPAAAFADIVLAPDAPALARIEARVREAPRAATALVLLLRGASGRSVGDSGGASRRSSPSARWAG